AIGAILPQIVPETHLVKVNGINGSIQALIMLLSPMASGILLTYSTITNIFYVDVVTAIIAVLILLIFLRVPSHQKAGERSESSYFSDLKKGFSYIKHHSFLKSFFFFFGIF